MKILVTGGAGFIGSFIVDELIEKGHEVRVYDALDPQVHGRSERPPRYLNKEAEFIKGNVLDEEGFFNALKDVDVLFHGAAAVGVGQSMYEVKRYVEQNSLGAAVMLDVIANREHGLKKMVVASSMSIYGEGKYRCGRCGPVYPDSRSQEQLEKRKWKARCPGCGSELTPLPTDEKKPLNPTSIYAITKRDHEEAFLSIGRAYRIPAVALRYFNAYGPRQALSNPYTGVCAIFSSRILNGKNPVIFEDGLQSRDFIHVKDVARASVLAMESGASDYQVFNVGSGNPVTILEVARILADKIKPGSGIEPEIRNTFREGDIRHCFADNSKIEEVLGFKPLISFQEGITDLTEWVAEQICEDRTTEAIRELQEKGLAE
ncbi:MAG: NAD-dependent epimerase/dehydratase family protein [Candidatus Omnitrophota bacterium]|nr:NAD-dependent epimerase/dehydratase family protein [Candidatus Omnitrophota bacterium]